MSELEPDTALFLYANNHEARIAFASVAMRHFQAFMDERETTFFWVTFIPGKFVVPESEAADFDPRRMQGWAHQALSGFSHLGMVELAYYTNVSALLRGHERGASWHSHHLVWGCEKATLQQRMKTLNAQSKAFLPGVEPAFAVELRPEEVIGKLLYMLKFPQSNYRCYPKKAKRFDAKTHKMISEPTGFFRQRKGELRPGEKARVCRMLEDAYLHRLAFAGGEGVPLLAAIRKDALLPYRREQSRVASRAAFSRARR
ncbi:hypothetical protein [Aureimonas jatrophae]|uniref:hypothetical protein n=1 Tax=Aureimonas jatrophae TaxID=1166073 RepID=UPI0011143F4A|nr:hypothetical protein [Aureimonas jatrophae]MBB3952354.1 hypothetical protein [Aureimonas jatrophae]